MRDEVPDGWTQPQQFVYGSAEELGEPDQLERLDGALTLLDGDVGRAGHPQRLCPRLLGEAAGLPGFLKPEAQYPRVDIPLDRWFAHRRATPRFWLARLAGV